MNRRGLTVLYTSHYMEEVEALCNRVGIMDDGRLIACDTVERLVASMGGALIEIGLPSGVSVPEPALEMLRKMDRVREVETVTSTGGLPESVHSAYSRGSS